MWGWDHMNGYGGWGLGWIFMLLFWVLVIAGIVALVRWISDGASGGRERSALDILKERYARGEIDEEEYQRKKKELLS